MVAEQDLNEMVDEEQDDLSQSSKTYTVDPRTAEWMLREWHFDGQRALRKQHVRFLAEEMRAGRFRRCAIDVRTHGGKVYLINGRHRLAAIVESGVAVDLVIIALECETMEQVRADYASFDRGLVRSYADAITAYDMESSTALTNAQLKRVSTAAPFIAGGFQSHQRAPDIMRSPVSRVEFVRVWSDVAVHAFSTFGEGRATQNRRIYTGAVFAVALATFRYQPADAEAFWRSIVENDGLRKTDPERALIEFLLSTPVSSTNAPRMARGVAAAWNARREGRMLQYIRIPNPLAPIRIHGTPYDGKRHYPISPKTMLIDKAFVDIDDGDLDLARD